MTRYSIDNVNIFFKKLKKHKNQEMTRDYHYLLPLVI